ncbi:MAG: hypothetical protein PHT88_02550 [Candidatus Moranbacteria bacterium]|nr:hypothetical protein [Candidatus Moranbacteria bacterium]
MSTYTTMRVFKILTSKGKTYFAEQEGLEILRSHNNLESVARSVKEKLATATTSIDFCFTPFHDATVGCDGKTLCHYKPLSEREKTIFLDALCSAGKPAE